MSKCCRSYKKDNEIRNFTFENYYKRIKFFKEKSYYWMKGLKKKTTNKQFIVACKQINWKIPHPCNAK